MSDVLHTEQRNEVLAGIVIATTVLVVGYASGFGHLVGGKAPSLPFAATAPSAPGSQPSTSSGGGSAPVGGPTVDTVSTAPGSPVEVGARDGVPAAQPGGPPGPGSVGAPSAGCDPALLAAIVQPFWTHLREGHLDESLGQQAGDILTTDQYVKTHTVLIEDMLAPVYAATSHATEAVSIFWMHVQHGHLDESPGQQAGDILTTDQYVKTHTVLVEDMLTPAASTTTGTC